MQELVTVLAKALVEKPEDVQVEAVEEEDRTVLKLHVAKDDMGRVIGKQGRIAKAIRSAPLHDVGKIAINDSVLQNLLDLGDTILDLALLVSGCIVLSVL